MIHEIQIRGKAGEPTYTETLKASTREDAEEKIISLGISPGRIIPENARFKRK